MKNVNNMNELIKDLPPASQNNARIIVRGVMNKLSQGYSPYLHNKLDTLLQRDVDFDHKGGKDYGMERELINE